MALRTLIIDDEPAARQRLQMLLEPYAEHIEIIGEAADGASAVGLIDSKRPDLIFLDIRMPLLSGLEVMQQVRHQPVVVFCTAYDKYALDAFNTLSIDYLLKPVSAERMAVTVDKLKRMERQVSLNDISALIRQIQPQPGKRQITTLPVRLGERILLVSVNEICYFRSADKYVSAFTRNGKEHLLDQTLKELEESLPPHFLRIHKSLIINSQVVFELQRYIGGRFVFIMDDNCRSRLVSGRNFADAVREYFGF